MKSPVLSSPPSSAQTAPAPPSDWPCTVEYDVAIAGAGIVGLTLACALRDSGLRVALMEANPPDVGMGRRRAYALTLMTGRILEGLQVWGDILPHITTFQHIRLADEHSSAVVTLQPQDLGTDALGYVGEHRVIMQALLKRLDGAPNLTWFCPAELSQASFHPDGVDLTLIINGEQKALRSRLLVAADGSRSPIRQQVGIGTKGWQYWQSCVTTVIRPEKPHGDIAREHFWRSGPFATLPLPDNRCQIVLTAPHAEAKAFLDMDEADFLAELERRYGDQLGRITLEEPRFLFPVQLMQSDRYVLPRLSLVGDAAHCCHPVGGQGLNLGIRDVAALAEVLRSAHCQHEDIGSLTVLHRYERWRKLENLTILGFTDILDRTFSNHWQPLVTLRRLGLRVMNWVRPLKFLALRLMTGLSGRTPELARR